MTSIKTTALILALAAMSGPVLAQTATQNLNQGRPLAPTASPPAGAAATLPNTFDEPTASTRAAPPPSTAAPQVTDAQMAEAALRAIIDQFRAAEINEALFTPGVATQLNGQLDTYSRLVRGYGAVQSIEPQGATGGVGQFLVVFENAATQWQVGLDDGGLVAALRFREAPPESSEPTSPGA